MIRVSQNPGPSAWNELLPNRKPLPSLSGNLKSDWLIEAQPLSLWLKSKYDLPLIGQNLMQFKSTHYLASWFGMLYDISIPFFFFYIEQNILLLFLLLYDCIGGIFAHLFQILLNLEHNYQHRQNHKYNLLLLTNHHYNLISLLYTVQVFVQISVKKILERFKRKSILIK